MIVLVCVYIALPIAVPFPTLRFGNGHAGNDEDAANQRRVDQGVVRPWGTGELDDHAAEHEQANHHRHVRNAKREANYLVENMLL